MPDATEILVCTFTSDLQFFENACLSEARAMRARVTVVRDADHGAPLAGVLHAGAQYTDVPVRCRSGGAFHPKIVVIAGADRAVVAIGSGNLTASGWHHNAELWTVLAAAHDEWPDTFSAVAEWLDRVPGRLHVDPFGARRIRDVAALLAGPTPRTTGPALVHNLDRPIIDAIPLLSSDAVSGATADELGIASPFLDPAAAALNEVTRRLTPAKATLALTVNAVGPAAGLDRWASGQHRVAMIAGRRYHHGKLVEWRTGPDRTALVGSANVTAAAMLLAADRPGGNVELGLLVDTDASLFPDLSDVAVDDPAALVRPPGERSAGPPTPRLLRILVDEATTYVYLLAAGSDANANTGTARFGRPTQVDGAATPTTAEDTFDGATLEVAGRSWSLIPAPGRDPDCEDPETDLAMRTLTVHHRVAAAVPCTVRLSSGQLLGPVPATDATAVIRKPGAGSPLEDATLGHVLGDPVLSRRLLDALTELAQLRPQTDVEASDTGRRAAGVRTSWQTAAERTVGPALITLALGVRRGADNLIVPDDEIGDWPNETDGDLPEGDDLGASETGRGSISAVIDADTGHADPVTLLQADAVTATRLARSLERLSRSVELAGWSLPALLVLAKLTLIVAAGRGWATSGESAGPWPDVLAAVLNRLRPDPAGFAGEVEESRHALATVGLAALATLVPDWDHPSAARSRFDRVRDRLELDPDWLDDRQATTR